MNAMEALEFLVELLLNFILVSSYFELKLPSLFMI